MTQTRTPSRTATPTPPPQGPPVVFFGVLNNFDGCVFCCDDSCRRTPTPTPLFDAQGRRVFLSKNGQVVIVVEGGAAPSRATPGTSLKAAGSDNRPDLQIESTNPLGNGSAAVCDLGPASQGGGGVANVNPPSFAAGNQTITNALLDFACRFSVATTGQNACTLTDASGDTHFISTAARIQFCDFISATSLFPPGESILTVQLRDTAGNLGPTAQIVLRVATPTPTPP